MENDVMKVADEILGYANDKPTLLGNALLLDWADRLQAIGKDLVYDNPEPVQGEVVGELTLDLNSIGEIRISTKYSDNAFIVESNQTQEFIQKFIKLQALVTL